ADAMTQLPDMMPLMNDIDALAMEWAMDGMTARCVADCDWPLAMPLNGYGCARRLREGIERFLITDIENPAGVDTAQSRLAVLWDGIARGAAMFNHVPGGCNVLYLDGHVEFQKWSAGTGPFPVNLAGLHFHHANHMLNGTSMP
ncbi:MAG: hypothetical protein HY706_08460, partial [Candidatus Hydrogenedentes bacterium]|nr:hypothetical protein [Candidatus Hydrogenedentota bacterium]